MQKSFILAVAALVSVALADSSSGNTISRRLNMGSDSESKRNVQAISTSYTTAQYCSTTRTYYYSRSFVCPKTSTYSSAQYCPSTRTYYYSYSFYCAPTVTSTIGSITSAVTSATTYSSAQYCSYTKSYYYSKAFIC